MSSTIILLVYCSIALPLMSSQMMWAEERARTESPKRKNVYCDHEECRNVFPSLTGRSPCRKSQYSSALDDKKELLEEEVQTPPTSNVSQTQKKKKRKRKSFRRYKK